MLDSLIAVFAVLMLAGLLAWAARRAQTGGLRAGLLRMGGAGAAGSALRETSRLVLTPQHRVHRVETAGGEVILLATHPGGVTVIPSRESGESGHPHAGPARGQESAGAAGREAYRAVAPARAGASAAGAPGGRA